MNSSSQHKYGFALPVVTTVFFMWGFVTVLNDILVPHLKALFDLNYTQTMLIQFTFFSAYFLMSIPSSRILARVGYQKSIMIGLGVMGSVALLFLPRRDAGFVRTVFGRILGIGFRHHPVASGGQPVRGATWAPDKSSSRLNLAQAFNSLGTTIAPYLGGLLILSGPVGDRRLRCRPETGRRRRRKAALYRDRGHPFPPRLCHLAIPPALAPGH